VESHCVNGLRSSLIALLAASFFLMVLSFSCALIFWGDWPVFILFFACVYWVLKNLADGFCTSSFYQADVLSIFFFLSFFVVFVFGCGFLKGWCAKQNDEINMAESDVEFYITGLQSSLIALLHCSDVYTVW